MEGIKRGFRLFVQDKGQTSCTNDIERIGYGMAKDLYDQLVLATILIKPCDLDTLLGMAGIDLYPSKGSS